MKTGTGHERTPLEAPPAMEVAALLLTPPDSPSSDEELERSGFSPTGEADEVSVISSFAPSDTRDDPWDALRGREAEGKVGGGGAVLIGPTKSCAAEVALLTPAGATAEETPAGATEREEVSHCDGQCEEEVVSREALHLGYGGGGADHIPGISFLPQESAVCVMQQKGGACSMTAPHVAPHESLNHSNISEAPPRSVLKRSGQRSRGQFRVSFNEAKNEVVESDYVILLRDEDEPQLVSIKALDLCLSSGATDQVTLSPPEGYKDAFARAFLDDHVSEAGGLAEIPGWGREIHDPDCPRAHLPDLVKFPPTLTMENIRHHDHLMVEGLFDDEDEANVAKTGILKGGKFWKNGTDGRGRPFSNYEEMNLDKAEEPRRTVRFSGRDEFTTLEAAAAFEKLPSLEQAALARLLSPNFEELTSLLVDHRGEWEFDSNALENAIDDLAAFQHFSDLRYHHECAKHPFKYEEPQMDDEQISESVQRYEEMRRRIAAAEGRDGNSMDSDDTHGGGFDAQGQDSANAESRIRRLENSDVAQVAGGVMRSNSEVRRAIERNALRRSLMKFAEARKKDTNKNEKSEKHETSLLEKLRWLTASEDATNGNAEEKGEDKHEPSGKQNSDLTKDHIADGEDNITQSTVDQYRKLAEMFNRTTALRNSEINLPGDVREWKLDTDLFKCEKGSGESEMDDFPPGTRTYTAVPAVSVCEPMVEEEAEKLIYSGGVRYTKEGILPMDSSPAMNGSITVTVDQPDGQSYSIEDIDEVLHDDRSSSVPSSSQSSPRLPGKDNDGASNAESGYSSNETTSEMSQTMPSEVDELAEFVKQDAGRIERVRKRFEDSDDHGFNRRPSVRGIKQRFGTTTDILKQMANQLIPPSMTQPTLKGSHMTWPYKNVGEDENGTVSAQRRRPGPTRSAPLPALQEDIPFTTQSDLSPTKSTPSIANNKGSRGGHMHSNSMDYSRLIASRDIPPPPKRVQSYTNISQGYQVEASQSLVGAAPPRNMITASNDFRASSSTNRRPASVHGHAPTDMVLSGPQHPTPCPRSFHGHQYAFHSRSQEDPGLSGHDASHMLIGPRSSYPGIVSEGSFNEPYSDHINYQHQIQTSPTENDDVKQRLLDGSNHDRGYVSSWLPSIANPTFVHTHNNLPIISSQLSYTTPIVPVGSYTTPIVPVGSCPRPPGVNLVNGMLIKMDSARGVHEGTSLELQYVQSNRDSGMILRYPPTMNVTT